MTGKKPIDHTTVAPGPGGYDPLDTLTRDKTKIVKLGGAGKKRSSITNKGAVDNPGPGSYANADFIPKGPKTTIGSKFRTLNND